MAMEIENQGNGHNPAAIGQMTDEAAQMAEQARVALEQAQEHVTNFIRERPLVCLAGALAIGYVVGKLVSR
jgi:ElaB/YqjD/DUF883 family membrane-anchored ribosome-binding protein